MDQMDPRHKRRMDRTIQRGMGLLQGSLDRDEQLKAARERRNLLAGYGTIDQWQALGDDVYRYVLSHVTDPPNAKVDLSVSPDEAVRLAVKEFGVDEPTVRALVGAGIQSAQAGAFRGNEVRANDYGGYFDIMPYNPSAPNINSGPEGFQEVGRRPSGPQPLALDGLQSGEFNAPASSNYGQVSAVLRDIVEETQRRTGVRVEITPSGGANRRGRTRNHPRGNALDIHLYYPDGSPVPNGSKAAYSQRQNAEGFRFYEAFAHEARKVQQEKYPYLGDKFRWGGYFVSGYSMDSMHFDIGGGGMAAGGWENGLKSQYAKAWGVPDKPPAANQLAHQIQQQRDESGITAQIQQFLKDRGYPLTVDGKTGPATTQAEEHFRNFSGMSPEMVMLGNMDDAPAPAPPAPASTYTPPDWAQQSKDYLETNKGTINPDAPLPNFALGAPPLPADLTPTAPSPTAGWQPSHLAMGIQPPLQRATPFSGDTIAQAVPDTPATPVGGAAQVANIPAVPAVPSPAGPTQQQLADMFAAAPWGDTPFAPPVPSDPAAPVQTVSAPSSVPAPPAAPGGGDTPASVQDRLAIARRQVQDNLARPVPDVVAPAVPPLASPPVRPASPPETATGMFDQLWASLHEDATPAERAALQTIGRDAERHDRTQRLAPAPNTGPFDPDFGRPSAATDAFNGWLNGLDQTPEVQAMADAIRRDAARYDRVQAGAPPAPGTGPYDPYFTSPNRLASAAPPDMPSVVPTRELTVPPPKAPMIENPAYSDYQQAIDAWRPSTLAMGLPGTGQAHAADFLGPPPVRHIPDPTWKPPPVIPLPPAPKPAQPRKQGTFAGWLDKIVPFFDRTPLSQLADSLGGSAKYQRYLPVSQQVIGQNYGGYIPNRIVRRAAPGSISGGPNYAYSTGTSARTGRQLTSYTDNNGRTHTFNTYGSGSPTAPPGSTYAF